MLSKMEHPPLEHRRISRAEREGSFLVTATVLTRNPPSSRGSAKNLRHQPTTQPLLLLIHHFPPLRHSAPERPLTKYVPFWGGTTNPKKRRVGFRSPCRRSAEAGAPSKGLKSGTGRGHSSWPPTARPPPPSIIQTPPTNTPPNPFPPLFKTPLPHPPTHPHSTSHYICYVSHMGL